MKGYRNLLHQKICTLFLNTVFISPTFIRGEVVKHLELPNDCVQLGQPNETDEAITMPLAITLDENKEEFMLVFSKRVEKPKEIETPKLVKQKHKWWQVGEHDTKVIVEKRMTKERPYFLLTSIK